MYLMPEDCQYGRNM